MNDNLAHNLVGSARAFPEHAALRGGDVGITYSELDAATARVAGMLRERGVQPGDRVGVMLPNVPEFALAYYGVLRAGGVVVPMNVLLKEREVAFYLADSGATLLFAWHEVAQVAQQGALSADTAVVEVEAGAFEQLSAAVPAADVVADRAPTDTAVILYTSGTTGKPKGIVHTTGGYLTGVTATTKLVFDLRDEDVFWCTADVGWVTGHSYLVYGPLSNGATCVMYEGAPDWPEKDRFWDLCERHGVTILYTAPTAIRAFMKWGEQYPARHDLSRLRLLGSVGEPINPEAWMWYHRHIGGSRCPIVDTWWQTETGAIAISPLPGVTATKPGSATRALPGYSATLLDSKASEIPVGGGLLAITKPWPSMLRTIWGDDQRYVNTYFSKWPGRPDLYFPGDGAKRDDEGYFWILGRVDDVLNVAGHRIGTMEVESALVEHPAVAEAAVVGKTHELKGQAIAAFVTLREGTRPSLELRDELRQFVAEKIGALARPDEVLFSADLPKTRSGKIMRRLLRDIAENRSLGDTTTLADPNVVANLTGQWQAAIEHRGAAEDEE